MPSTLPDKLDGQGLLVATIAANTVASTRIEQLAFSLADVQIDNTSYSNAIRNNYLVLPLQPGEYTLDSLHVFRNTTDRSQVRYPVNFRFRIVAGQATNLGVIVLLRNTKAQPSENRYWNIQVDNTEDMPAHLRKRYQKLAASLSPPAPALVSDVKYADANLMELMRRRSPACDRIPLSGHHRIYPRLFKPRRKAWSAKWANRLCLHDPINLYRNATPRPCARINLCLKPSS